MFDLRTQYPWDREAVFASVEKTGRLFVVHKAVLVGGYGSEIAAEAGEHLFLTLRGRCGGSAGRASQYR